MQKSIYIMVLSHTFYIFIHKKGDDRYMSKTVLFSNRIYKKDLPDETNSIICGLTKDYGHLLYGITKELTERYKHGYKLSYTDIGRNNITLYNEIVSTFPSIPTYVRNTAYREAKGLIDAVVSNKKNRIAEGKQRLKNIDKKICNTVKRKQTFDNYKQRLKNNNIKGLFNKSKTFKIKEDNSVVRYAGIDKNKKVIQTFNNLYDFECFVDTEIKKLKARIGQLDFRKDKLQTELNKLTSKNYIPNIQFGGKKLCKQSKIDKKKKKEFLSKRYNRFECSGRNDSRYGNYIFEYDPALHILRLNHLNSSDNTKTKCIEIPSVFFPYGQDIIDNYYKFQTRPDIYNNKNSGRKPITYSIEDKDKYYIIKCTVDEESPPKVVESFANGAIGIDINCGFLSVCETDRNGNLLRAFDKHYKYYKQSANQISNNICNAVKQITEYSLSRNKPIVIENLKIPTSDKIKQYNSGKKKNFKISVFAYSKIKEAMHSSCNKLGIEIREVNPIYTSLIGKLKYEPYYKRSIHQTAAFTIGRRGIGYRETIPAVWKEKLQQNSKQINWKNVYQLYKNKK